MTPYKCPSVLGLTFIENKNRRVSKIFRAKKDFLKIHTLRELVESLTKYLSWKKTGKKIVSREKEYCTGKKELMVRLSHVLPDFLSQKLCCKVKETYFH